jgi:hypothetical protein
MGSRTGNWIRTVSRDFMLGLAIFPGQAADQRTVSLFGSFRPGMEETNQSRS